MSNPQQPLPEEPELTDDDLEQVTGGVFTRVEFNDVKPKHPITDGTSNT